MVFSAEKLRQKARELGFNFAGIVPARPSPILDAYFHWIDAGMHGNMGYLARPDRQIRRRDLSVILPDVVSMLIVGLDYRVSGLSENALNDPSRGRIASYAWGLDYHDLMTPRLESLAAWLRQEAGLRSHRVYVDTGAILERVHGQQAGLGFVGKNTMLIHPRRGSYFFLGEILLSLEFDEYDRPARETMCGSCTRCLSACPTDAFPRPYVLDARRCISYLTIENKKTIPHEYRHLMGNWVFGCDICQDVCPWQRFAMDTDEASFVPSGLDRAAPPLLHLLAIDNSTFEDMFRGSPIYRIKRERLVRNACIAAGNWGDEKAVPLLERLLDDPGPLVRSHAAWGYYQILGTAAVDRLKGLLERESDDSVKADILETLEG